MVKKEHTERVVWERTANMKSGLVKIPGKLVVTTKKIMFKPFLAKNQVIILLKDIDSASSTDSIRSKLKLRAGNKEYYFSIKDAQHLSSLISALLENPQDL